MIFKGLKFAVARKKLSSLTENRSLPHYQVPIQSMGLIVDPRNQKVISAIKEMANKMQISKSNFKIVIVGETDILEDEADLLNLTWKGVNIKAEIIQADLKDFIIKEFDLLITFAEENNLLAHLVAASSKAGIKAGRYVKNEALFDVILQAEEDVTLFVEELSKYLKQLKLTADV